jgi:hypothetical protein
LFAKLALERIDLTHCHSLRPGYKAQLSHHVEIVREIA